jgi:hypothetical protein
MTKTNQGMGKNSATFRLSLVGAKGPHLLISWSSLEKKKQWQIQKQLKLYKVKKPP